MIGIPSWCTKPFSLAALAVATTCCLGAVAADRLPPSRVALCAVLASIPYLWLIWAPMPAPMRDWRWPVLVALVPGLSLCAAPSVLSDDLYRYAWDARLWLSGQNAYLRAPSDPALSPLRDSRVYPHINHRSIATIYPPIAQLWFVLSGGLGRGVVALKLGALLGHLLTALSLPALVRAQAGHASPEVAARAMWLWALNPLALYESALSGHVDVWIGLLVVWIAVWLIRRRTWAAALGISLAAGLKVVGVFLLPLQAFRARAAGGRPVAAWLSLPLCALLLLPLFGAGAQTGQAVSGLGRFSQHWRGNAGPFALIEQACGPLVDLLATETRGPDRPGPQEVALGAVRPWLGPLAALGVDPHARRELERKTARDPVIFGRAYAVGMLARSLSVALICALAWMVSRRAVSPAIGARWILLAVLLMSPQVHPWYLLWLLPLEIALERRVALIWSLVILGAYSSLDAWIAARTWVESAGFRAFEYALVGGALLLEQKRVVRNALTRCYQRLKLVSS